MSKSIESYRDLIAWQRAYELGLEMYRATATFPSEERFGLTAQLRRATIAVASDIAEGYGRGTTDDYLRFLRMSRGSLYEIDTQWLFALGLGYVDEATYDDLKHQVDECERILAGLIRSVRRSASKKDQQPNPDA